MTAIDEGKFCGSLLLDLSAGFDVIDFEILLEKLKLYGFQEEAVSWFRSYLADRFQCVQIQSGRTEAPASTIPPVLQRCWKSVYLVQLSKSGKYASGKKVAQNTSEYCNFARNTLHFSNLALGASTLPKISVFWATFLPEAYLPDFDSCTKYIDFWKRWSTRGIVEAGASALPDWIWIIVHPLNINSSTY